MRDTRGPGAKDAGPGRNSVRLLYRLSFTSRCFCPRICIIDAEDTPCRPKPLTYMRPRPTWSSCYHWWLLAQRLSSRKAVPHWHVSCPWQEPPHASPAYTRALSGPARTLTTHCPTNSGPARHEGAAGYARLHLVG